MAAKTIAPMVKRRLPDTIQRSNGHRIPGKAGPRAK